MFKMVLILTLSVMCFAATSFAGFFDDISNALSGDKKEESAKSEPEKESANTSKTVKTRKKRKSQASESGNENSSPAVVVERNDAKIAELRKEIYEAKTEKAEPVANKAPARKKKAKKADN